MMFSYHHHIGDFVRDTARLSDSQCMAYLRLLWMYYDTEQPLIDDPEKLSFQIGSDSKTVALILSHYFTLDGAKWIHQRCEKEIQAYRERSKLSQKAANARWKNADAMRTHSERNADAPVFDANREPITENRHIKEANASLSAGKLPDCPHKQIVELYGKHLPHLPQPRTWDGTRQQNLRARWAQCAKPSSFNDEGYSTMDAGIAFWDSFFAYIANDTKLSKGFESNGRTWQPDLPWIVKAANFAKIIDGKYDV